MRNFSKAMLNNDGMQMLEMQEGLRYCFTITADLATVASTAFSAASVTRANAAAGPIMDLPGLANLLSVKAQEMKEILNYMLSGNAIGSGSSGPVQSGDANYTLLNNTQTSL